MHKTYMEHEYLLKSDKLDPRTIEALNLYIDPINYKSLTKEDILNGLCFLSDSLVTHFGA